MKIYLLAFLFLTFSTNIYCQEDEVISIDKVDDMTGKSILKTNWLSIRLEMTKNYYARFCKVDSCMFFDLKIATGFVTSVEKNADLILKLSNDSLMTLNNIEYTISGRGDGAIGLAASDAQGINPKFQLTRNQLETLSKYQIVKLRLYLRDSYIETELKPNKSEKIKYYCFTFSERINKKN